MLLFAVWQEPKKTTAPILSNPGTALAYAQAFRKAGVSVGIWGYPSAEGVDEYVRKMRQSADAIGGASVWCHDPELEFKWGLGHKLTEPSVRRAAGDLIVKAEARCGPGVHHCLTSYPLVSSHPTLPWKELSESVRDRWTGMPQTYSRTPDQVTRSLDQWSKLFTLVLPATAAFGPNSGFQLPRYLDSHGDVPGYCVWSWPQMSAYEWAVYRDRSAKWKIPKTLPK